MLLSRKKTRTKRRVITLLIQIIFFVGLFILVRGWTQKDMITGPAPQITATDLQGETVALRDYLGQPLLLSFWASWCKICELEQGAVNAVSKSWPVLTVAMQSGDKQEVTDFIQTQGLDWRTIVDESGSLAKRYGVPGVPAHFILDAAGNIRYREMGYTTTLGLKARLWLARIFYSNPD